MRYLFSLTLAAVATLSVAGCATTHGEPAVNKYTVAQISGGPDCRRLAQPGDTKIHIYCKKSIWPVTSGSEIAQSASDTTCRSLAQPDKRIQPVCHSSAEWDEFDTAAVNTGMSCRWFGSGRRNAPAAQEVCLTSSQWAMVETNRAARAISSSGANWPGSGVVQSAPQGPASSYGATCCNGYSLY